MGRNLSWLLMPVAALIGFTVAGWGADYPIRRIASAQTVPHSESPTPGRLSLGDIMRVVVETISGKTARPRHSAGRWALLYTDGIKDQTKALEATCKMLLERYGVVFRELLSREAILEGNGLRWRDAPREYGPHKTIYNRFVRWSRLGVFNKIFAALAAKGGKPDRLMIDATHLKAHRTAASLLKKGLFPDVLGAPKAA